MSRSPRAALALVAAVAVLALLGAAFALPQPGARAAFVAPPAVPSPAILLDLPVAGLANPVDLQTAGDARLFVVEKRGTIRIVQGGIVLTTPYLDVSALVSTGTEQGLLGLAFHPQYAANGYFYIDYTDLSGTIRVVRYTRSASDPNQADPNSAYPLLSIPHPTFTNHNGGQLAFGPEGYLYVATGDGGSGCDPPNNAQNRAVLLGKLLRVDVNVPAPTPYAIPTTNPFYGQPGLRGEIWDWGLRNPWRFSFDSGTHDLYIGDVGQNTYEEIDQEPAGGPGGWNYGWRLWEGRVSPPPGCATPTPGPTPPFTYVTPVAVYSHATGDCAVIGGYVYRGPQSPTLTGVYFFGDNCTGRIRSLEQVAPGVWQMDLPLDTTGAITAFGQDVQGELYVLFGGTAAGTPSVYHVREAVTVTPTPSMTPTPKTPTPTDTATAPPATATASATPTPSNAPSATPTTAASPTPTGTLSPTPVPAGIDLLPLVLK